MHPVMIKIKKYTLILFLVLATACPDQAGAEIGVPPKRIISLAPNVTEILFALGLEKNIVGVTSFCDYPEAAKAKPRIGGMSNPSLEAVVSLKPDLVVMTTDGNPREFAERLRALRVPIAVFTARRIAELPRGIRQIGAALGVPERAEALAHEIEGTFERKGDFGGGSKRKGKVLFIVWPEPLIVAGPRTAMNDVINLLGYENVAEKAKSAYPKYSLEEVVRHPPDKIVIGKGSGMDMRAVSQGVLARMASAPAVRNGAVCYVGDNLYRLGPRIVPGIKELAACLK